MEGGKVSTPISGLKGIELERSLLMALQEARGQMDYLLSADINRWSDNQVEMFVRNLSILDDNINEMIAIIDSGEHRHAGD